MATLFGTTAVFDGMHAGWSPRKQVFGPFTTMPITVGSFYATRLPHHDVFVSNELPRVTDDGTRFTWELWGRRGTSRWFVGTPRLDSPRALHLPYFYWPWPLLSLAPRSRDAKRRGLSFVASNVDNGGLAKRRLDLALALAPHYPVHLSSGLKAHVPAGAPVTFHDVPRGPFGKHTFLERFTFNLASENERADGYLTEKPVEALMAGAVPVYEGDPGVGQWLDGDAYIDCAGLSAEVVLGQLLAFEGERARRVDVQRERLVRVGFEAMMGRIWELAARVRAEGEGEPDWRERGRVARLRRAAAAPQTLDRWLERLGQLTAGDVARGVARRLRAWRGR